MTSGSTVSPAHMTVTAQEPSRETPGGHPRPRKDARPQHGGGQEQRGEDRRERPIVADAPEPGIGLEAVVLPPESDPVGGTLPEAGCVVPLEQPPRPDRDQPEQAAVHP